MKYIKILLLLIILFIFCFNVFGQQQNTNSVLSRSFQGISLGIDREEFEKIIKEKNFTVQGELDVYFNQPDKSVIAVLFPPYFRKILFFFYKEKLAMIIFFFDTRYITIYEEYSRLYSKYGLPTVNQKQFVWEDNETMLILEKEPFIVKLIDKSFFKQIEQENQQIQNIIQKSLDYALDTL